MAEPTYDPNLDFNVWLSYDLKDRMLTASTLSVKAQAYPNDVTRREWFLLGVAAKDEEAIAELARESRDYNLDIDYEEILSTNAIKGAVSRVEGDERFNAHSTWKQGWQTERHDTFQYNFFEAAETAGEWISFGVIAALGAAGASAAMTAGAAWVASSTAATGAAAGLSGPTQRSMETAIHMMNNGGISKAMYWSRIGSAATATLGTAVRIHDVSAAMTDPDPESTAGRQQRNIYLADLQKQGYTIEQAGTALGEGEIYAIDSEEDIIIKDVDGNVISSDEKDALLDGGGVPAGLLNEDGILRSEIPDTDIGPVDATLYGAADQYSGSGQLGDQSLEAAIAGARDLATPQEKVDEQHARHAAERRANPYVGGLQEGYKRINDPDSGFQETTNYRNPGDPWDPAAADKPQAINKYGEPTYRMNDIQDEIARWDYIRVLEFQNKAIEAGLINPDTTIDGLRYYPGTIDPHTIRALEGAMASANTYGDNQTYDAAMDQMVIARDEYMDKFGDPNAPPTWTPSRAYFAPDYAEISQRAKGTFRSQLGRDPNGWEMDLLADQFKSDHRSEYDEKMQGEKAAFDASGRAQETGEIEVPAAQQDINPEARMAETFEDTFSDELDAKSRWADVQSKSRNLFGSFNKLANS